MDTTTLLPLLIAALAGGAALLTFAGAGALRREPELRERLSEYLATSPDAPLTSREVELAEPFFQRVVAPLLRRLLKLMGWIWPKNRVEAMRHRLVMAGRPGGLTVEDFIGIKGWSLLLIGGGAGLLGYLGGYPRTLQALLMWLLLCMVSLFLPDIWLSRRVRQRQEEIVTVMPDTLDMMVVAVEAGLSFENALLEITNKWRHALSQELLQVQRDIGIGLARRQALQEMSERTGVPDVSQLVSAINQAEELGISVVRVLQVQAEEMRVKRRQRAQEAANKAPIKMLFPMVFLIFPALFAVLLGPGVPSLIRALNGL
ncbi:MAG TPA: type II secretion system F family protein [Chloroflexaceae bacterium]|nr:type II secretion system F family protein [Chloroflexaceae bacterium]